MPIIKANGDVEYTIEEWQTLNPVAHHAAVKQGKFKRVREGRTGLTYFDYDRDNMLVALRTRFPDGFDRITDYIPLLWEITKHRISGPQGSWYHIFGEHREGAPMVGYLKGKVELVGNRCVWVKGPVAVVNKTA